MKEGVGGGGRERDRKEGKEVQGGIEERRKRVSKSKERGG